MRPLYRCLAAFAVLSAIAFAQDAAPQSQRIVETAFTVPANSSKQYTFKVPPGLKSAQLVGHFHATGGIHNQIVVCVMNDDQFVNWQNDPIRNNPIKDNFRGALYTSHKATQGSIKLPLSTEPGTYHVLFYNGYSV